jgi:dTDP-N-acetylfucosamine:lipid II N-acetylfucosaminyltransferase
MILHFIKDEKFSDILIENFAVLNVPQTWLFFDAKNFEELKLTKYRGENVRFIASEEDEIEKLFHSIAPDFIVMHSLNPEFGKALLKLPKRIPVSWFLWGYGMYSLPKLRFQQFSLRTKAWIKSVDRFGEFKNGLKSFSIFRKLHSLIYPGGDDSIGVTLKAIRKIDFIAAIVREDYEMFSRHYGSHLAFIPCINAHIRQIAGSIVDAHINPDASHILIGNSNTPTCNYHDAIKLVETLGHKGMKAYIIMSYGDNEAYSSEIARYAACQKRVDFEIITEFIPLQEYIALLQNCSVGIFHHYRQQAMGNIVAMLYMGARVYLCERNPVYSYLKRHGIHVFSIEEDAPSIGFTRLETSCAIENRVILEEVFSYENMVKDIHHWFEVVSSMNNDLNR